MMFNDIYYLQFNFLYNVPLIVHALHLNKKEKSSLGTFVKTIIKIFDPVT